MKKPQTAALGPEKTASTPADPQKTTEQKPTATLPATQTGAAAPAAAAPATTAVSIKDKLGLRLDEAGNLDLPSLAYVLVTSGMFPDITSVSQAIVKIMVGREIGLGPMQSVINVHVIRDDFKNKTSIMVGAHTIAAKIKGSGRYDYEILTLNAEECSLQPYTVGTNELGQRVPRKINHVVKFTIAQAKTAKFGGWGKDGQKFKDSTNWAKDPESMLFARAISRMEKQHFPDLTGLPVYTPDELGFRVDDSGEAMVVRGHLVPDDIPEGDQTKGPAVSVQTVVRQPASATKVGKLKAIAKQNSWSPEQFYTMVGLEMGFTDPARAATLVKAMEWEELAGMIADESYDLLLAKVGMEYEVYLDFRNNPPAARATSDPRLPAGLFGGEKQ